LAIFDVATTADPERLVFAAQLINAVLSLQIQHSWFVLFKLLPEPLDHFEVVLILALHYFVDLNQLGDADSLYSLLQQLQIVYELVLSPGFDVDLRNRKFAWVQQLHHLAVGHSRAQLLYLYVVALEETVYPCQQLSAGHVRCRVHQRQICHAWTVRFKFKRKIIANEIVDA
jgi:hypothetical protein